MYTLIPFEWCTLGLNTRTDAQYFYGLVKYYGEATDKELPTAAKYFRKAATQGHKEAAINIALMYYNGMGKPARCSHTQ